MRVLIVETSLMGDVFHMLPIPTGAQQAIPGIKLDWAVEEGFAQILSWHAAAERAIPMATCHWYKAWSSASVKAEHKAFREALQAENYDVVIDAQGLIESAVLVTRLVYGVKYDIDWQAAHEPLASLLYNRKHHIVKQQHAVERTHELFAKSSGCNKLQTQDDYTIVQHFLTNWFIDVGEYAVFLHMTTRDDKHWPKGHWQELIGLPADSGIRIRLPRGASHREERAKRLAEGFAYVEALPKTSLKGVAHVLIGVKFVVSVDTRLSHLAAALDRPDVMVYGPADPGLVGGYGKNQMVRRAPGNELSRLIANAVKQLIEENIERAVMV